MLNTIRYTIRWDSREVDGGVPTLAISDDVCSFAPAVSITRNCAALNASRLATCVARLSSLLRIVAA